MPDINPTETYLRKVQRDAYVCFLPALLAFVPAQSLVNKRLLDGLDLSNGFWDSYLYASVFGIYLGYAYISKKFPKNASNGFEAEVFEFYRKTKREQMLIWSFISLLGVIFYGLSSSKLCMYSSAATISVMAMEIPTLKRIARNARLSPEARQRFWNGEMP